MNMGRTGTAAAFLGGRDGSFFFFKKKTTRNRVPARKKKKNQTYFPTYLGCGSGDVTAMENGRD